MVLRLLEDGDSIKNKVFVKVIVPEIDQSFDLYLPVNKKIGNIITLMGNAISELVNEEKQFSKTALLYNQNTNERYSSDVLLANTNIRNGTTLVFIS